jgi:hypothetical protein
VLLSCWLWSQTRGIRLPIVLGGLFAFLGLLAAGGLGTGWEKEVLLERFIDMSSISVNASDRLWTIATSFDLMLHNPLGMGSAYVEPLQTATGTSATHNAYLELALMGGLPITILVVARLIRMASRLFTTCRPVEAWLAAYLLGIFLFESYFLQISILLVTFWLVISPARSSARESASRRSTSMQFRTRRHYPARPTARSLSG